MNNIRNQFKATIFLSAVFSIVIAAASVGPVNAAEVSGAKFKSVIKDEGVEMDLQGAGLKSMIFFKAFAAGFYSNEPAQGKMLGQYPKRIEVEYFVNIPATKMNAFTVESMQENVTEEEFSQISSEVDLMGNYFVDLKPGDRYSLTYIPGVGTKFVHNDQLVGVIEGSAFAKALFSTWLGDKPFDKKLKTKILGSSVEQDEKELALLGQG